MTKAQLVQWDNFYKALLPSTNSVAPSPGVNFLFRNTEADNLKTFLKYNLISTVLGGTGGAQGDLSCMTQHRKVLEVAFPCKG